MVRVTAFGQGHSDLRDHYIERLQKMIPFHWVNIPLRHNPDKRPSELLSEEKEFLKNYKATEFYLMDVDGRSFSDNKLSQWAFQQDRHLIIGPPVGFHHEFQELAKGKISLSSLTFTHILAQAILAESLYRAACSQFNHPFVK